MPPAYEFTNDWFAIHEPVWRNMVAEINPQRILEVGTYEGQSAIFLIENCAPRGNFEITCIDTWDGGMEHDAATMSAVEARFDRNIERARKLHTFALRKMKADSVEAMAQLLAEGAASSFDVSYIDASHQAPDVLADAVLAFKLTRVGGILIFDDYLWRLANAAGDDLLNQPKVAVDAFVNTYFRKLSLIGGAPLRQFYARKISN